MEKIKRRKAPKVKFFYLCLLAIATSMLGWIVENVFRGFCNRTIDCRFHLLPFLSPYGLIVFAYYLLLSDPNDIAVFGKNIFKQKTKTTVVLSNLLCWAGMCVAVFLGELAVGNIWYYLTGVELWHYSNGICVTQFTGVCQALAYGTAAYALFRFVYRPSIRWVQNKVPYKVAKIISLTLGTLIVADTILMGVMIAVNGKAPMWWRITFCMPVYLITP
ncbi:MAG: hypothetical protein ACI4MI_02455 [Christensenellales bacterium]